MQNHDHSQHFSKIGSFSFPFTPFPFRILFPLFFSSPAGQPFISADKKANKKRTSEEMRFYHSV